MARPRVVIDARMVERVPHGIARYVTALARGLAALRKVYPPSYDPVFLIGEEGEKELAGFECLRARARFLARNELRELPGLLRDAGAALYHSPSFSSLPTWGPWRAPCPWVLTIHDLNHLAFGDWKQKLYYRTLLKPFALRAAALATVSEFSRKELAAWLGVDAGRIEVVHNALEPALANPPPEREAEEILRRFELQPGHYFLCISNPKPHKNLATLVEAYSRLVDRDWPLVLSMTEFSGPGIRAVGALEDTEARALRASAGAVAFPSLYEGFGLPPVEAAVAGAPLVVSRIPPHEEGLADLAPDEALWVDEPASAQAWEAALASARRGQVERTHPETRARILARFSTEALARHMDRIYRRVLLQRVPFGNTGSP